jgi:pimeloyl-ACP methyl ester carboxylesterase
MIPAPSALVLPAVLLAFASQAAPGELNGLYRSAEGAALVLFPAPPQPEQTALIELASGAVRVLTERNEDEFTFGPALAVPEPVQGSLIVLREPDGRIRGLLRQDSQGAEQQLARVSLRSEPAGFANGAVQLAGTLLVPEGPGPFPALVMLHGSEPEPREGNLGLALFLVSEGFATLIFDKRGVGASQAPNWEASFDEYAGDAAAGFAWLRARSEIDAVRIGYWGHSQGAWIAALAGARTPAAAFVVLECGGALDPIETTLWWGQRKLESEGRLTPAEIQACLDYRRRKFHVVAGTLSAAELEPFTAEARAARWFPHVTERLPAGPFGEANARYDPRPALESLSHCAVLALFAENDDHTPTPPSVAAARAAFERSRHPRAAVHVIPAANHGFFETKTGARMELELPTLERFAPGYTPLLTGWLKEATRR